MKWNAKVDWDIEEAKLRKAESKQRSVEMLLDVEQIARDVENAYDHLLMKKKGYHAASISLILANEDLETKKLAGLASGEIEGRNKDMREAAARELLADEYQQVELAENKEREAKFDLDLAYINLDKARDLLRVAELAERQHVGRK